jgi:iron complex outermembrane receptor protein
METDRTGATMPTAFANKRGINVTAGVTRQFGNSFELIIDGGVRNKKQQAFSSLSGFDSSDDRELTTVSFTPRFIGQHDLLGMRSKVIAGLISMILAAFKPQHVAQRSADSSV